MQAIGAAIEEVVAPSGFSIVRGFVGHGIGHAFHMPPNVVHHRCAATAHHSMRGRVVQLARKRAHRVLMRVSLPAAVCALLPRNEDRNGEMAVGHTFTIEPMVNENAVAVNEWPDKWTIATADGGRSAQFEHTLLIVPGGVEILTPQTENSQPAWWLS